ncbi:hypothetical protein P3T76_012423 [Phytophthora citrophthora]|uniref:Uncharacterized protein n=1 Tax=Phytophthora citrophthora TaxID=4793 RepID=A0AAD9G4Z0_9STRA|nr:hypothetical protein P3T76_012423 [Phytophthora citrophthora]
MSLETVKETILLVVQILTLFSSFWAVLSTMHSTSSSDNVQELYNLIAPPSSVLSVALYMFGCFLFNVLIGPKTTTGTFIERYSIEGANELLYLNVAAKVAATCTWLWLVFKLLNWRYMAIIALSLVWCGSLPLYLANNRRSFYTFRDFVIVLVGNCSIRLYFWWLTGALIFGLLDVAQYIHGSIFSYDVYVRVMISMLVLPFVVFGQTRDSVVMIVAQWFLFQSTNIEDYEGDDDVKKTFKKLHEVAEDMSLGFTIAILFVSIVSLAAGYREDALVSKRCSSCKLTSKSSYNFFQSVRIRFMNERQNTNYGTV